MYCEKCGNKLENNKCNSCGFEKFFNSIPVAVAIIPVMDHGALKVLTVRRNIEPKKGHLALPGGFQEIENIVDGLKREVQEECELSVEVDEKYNQLVLSSDPNPNRTLIFFVCKEINKDLINFNMINSETSEMCLINDKDSLAFPLHEKAVKWFFKEYQKLMKA